MNDVKNNSRFKLNYNILLMKIIKLNKLKKIKIKNDEIFK